MHYRRFGKTELHLPVFSLGGMRFKKGWEGPHDVLPEDTLEEAFAVTQHAWNVGINHFETARDYGRGERIYGKIWPMLKVPREQILFTTKIAPMPSYDKMRECIEDSLTRMNIDYIDNFDIHGVNSEEKYDRLFYGGCLDAVFDAMKEGLIRHLGFSTHADLPLILKIIDTDVFESINLHYYYFFQRNWPAVQRAFEKDMGVFIISPNDKGGQLFNPSEQLTQLTDPLHPMNFNDRFCLSHPEVHTLSLGANTPEQIDSHLPSLELDEAPDLDPTSPFGLIKARMDQQMASLDTELCTNCYECLPCPEGIGIPEVLRFRNMWKAFDMQQFVSYRYNMLEKHGDWFPGRFANHCTDCGDCLPRCPQELPIPQLLKELHQEFYK